MTLTFKDRLDLTTIRKQFPVLDQSVNGNPLIYLDNAATTQKPLTVINEISRYYTQDNANIHRGIHTLAERATATYENTRKSVAQFINANESEEIVFTKGTTDSINLVAQSLGKYILKPGDEVLISCMEHHSNIVPWQMICQETKAILKIIPINEGGEIIFEEFLNMISERTKIVSMVHISNSLGTINPVKKAIIEAHKLGAKVLIDGAQAPPHEKIDVKSLNCDFYAFSGHKMYGPTGIGVLYGKRSLLEAIPPYQGGGEMIKEVSFTQTSYNEIPYKFEAGTPNIAAVNGLNKAIKFIESIGLDEISHHENNLLLRATKQLNEIEEFRPMGTASEKASVISFNIEGVHPFDLGVLLDAKGIAIRTGHHCTQPLMERFNVEGTARVSFAIYNTLEEVDQFIWALNNLIKKLI
ncbi:MAG: cysteine desulfurase CsdA [Flammeovirgaceae bacterium]|nr:cysteine desulfurase CsdA [Flammeovirgaceae bacterium]